MKRIFIMCAGVLAILGCGEDDEALPSELSSLRIVGVLSSESDLNLGEVFLGSSEPIKVSIVDFHPDDLTGQRVERTYRWDVCFSIGAFTRFECLDETKKLTFTGDDPFIDVPTDAITLFGLFPDLPDDEATSDPEDDKKDDALPGGFELSKGDICPDGLGESCATSDECAEGLFCSEGICSASPSILPLPLVVKVTVSTPDGQERTGARSINLRLSGENNQNPSFTALEIRGELIPLAPMEHSASPCAQIGPFALGLDEVPVTAIIDESRLETVEYAEGAECIEDDESDDVYLSWYTTLGTLENEAGSLEFNENTLVDLPDEAASARMYLAIRDGRGGISISCLEYEIQATP